MSNADELLQGLADDGAELQIYDPKATQVQMKKDLATPKFEWDHPHDELERTNTSDHVTFHENAYSACKDAHGIAILTEWDEFKTLDYVKIYAGMKKPAFCFDGRNIMNHEELRNIGFIVYGLGKPLDAFIKKSYG